MNSTSKKTVGESILTPKKEKTNLQVRLISAIFLVILMIVYLLLPIFHTEINRSEGESTLLANIFGYLSLLTTAILIGASVYEFNKAVGIRKWPVQIVLIATALFIFVWPFGQIETLRDLFFYRFININFLKGMRSPWVCTIILILGFVIIGIVGWRTEKRPAKDPTQIKRGTYKQGLLIFAITIIIVFAMKGFTTISLSVRYDNSSINPLFLDSLPNVYANDFVQLAENTPTYSFTAILWIWCTIIFTDTFAYLGGSKFGKHKLSPRISPNKSWEGAIIGTAVAALIGIGFSVSLLFIEETQEFAPLFGIIYILVEGDTAWIPILIFIFITIAVSITGQIGDLLFSAIKRNLGIKDYSNLIPGHGGILDRLDSFYLVFFMIYILTLFA
ncbi:phosphatidate cytidylyltransferase [Mesoplasma seiffertii]|uniref:phosphatidate cytidylyltransferase n=1 Tax=Mesoplasma seiffertii TaxID=28224 RepID=UPI000687140A|nr:phosphatidate cytidylyltransferase [Mesoplasma seiffertii]